MPGGENLDFGRQTACRRAGGENLISSAERFRQRAWREYDSLAGARSASFAALPSRVTYIVVDTSFTSTDLPSAVFTVTESAETFSRVPTTCFLSPWAKAGVDGQSKDCDQRKEMRNLHWCLLLTGQFRAPRAGTNLTWSAVSTPFFVMTFTTIWSPTEMSFSLAGACVLLLT